MLSKRRVSAAGLVLDRPNGRSKPQVWAKLTRSWARGSPLWRDATPAAASSTTWSRPWAKLWEVAGNRPDLLADLAGDLLGLAEGARSPSQPEEALGCIVT
jgi:hypothetical protein